MAKKRQPKSTIQNIQARKCQPLTTAMHYSALDPFYWARNRTAAPGNSSLSKLANTLCIERCHLMALQCSGLCTNSPSLKECATSTGHHNLISLSFHFQWTYCWCVAGICCELTYIWLMSLCCLENSLARRTACNRTAKWCCVICILIGNQRNCNARHIVRIAHVRRDSPAAPVYTVQSLLSTQLS